MPGRAGGDRRPVDEPADQLEVVGDLERPEAGRADVVRTEDLGRPQLRQRRPTMRSAAMTGPASGRSSFRSAARCSSPCSSVLPAPLGTRSWAGRASGPDTRRPFLGGRVSGGFPYLAGGPARIWHLADVAAGRLSWHRRAGPSATLDKSYSVAADGTGDGTTSSTARTTWRWPSLGAGQRVPGRRLLAPGNAD